MKRIFSRRQWRYEKKRQGNWTLKGEIEEGIFIFFNSDRDILIWKNYTTRLGAKQNTTTTRLMYWYKRYILYTNWNYLTLALKLRTRSTPCLGRQYAIPFIDLLAWWNETWKRDRRWHILLNKNCILHGSFREFSSIGQITLYYEIVVRPVAPLKKGVGSCEHPPR